MTDVPAYWLLLLRSSNQRIVEFEKWTSGQTKTLFCLLSTGFRSDRARPSNWDRYLRRHGHLRRRDNLLVSIIFFNY